MPLLEYERVGVAREHLKEILDTAAAGSPVSVRRDAKRFAVVDVARLRHFLASIGPRPEVAAEDGGWSLFFPGLPIAAEGATFDEAIDDAIVVLREYADDWMDHLHTASNHANTWGLVQLVALSSDDQLRGWLTGADQEEVASSKP